MNAKSRLVRPPRRAFGQLLLTETRLTLRTPIGIVLGLGLPALLVVIFGSIPAFRLPADPSAESTILSYYAPILSVFSLAFIALVGLPMPLATYRELGVLRRLSCTPVPPSWMLGAQLIINLAIAVIALLVINVGMQAFGVPPPGNPVGYAVAMTMSAATLLAIGLWVLGTARTANMANAIGQSLFFPLMFFAGLYFPREMMPETLRAISDWTPLGAGVDALQTAATGDFPAAPPLLVMLGYTIFFGYLAIRRFRWE